MSAEHTVTELRCEILDLEAKVAKLEAALERSCTCQVYGMTPICAACEALKEAK